MEQKELEVDLEHLEIRGPGLAPISFSVDPFSRHCLLNGLDEIGLTMQKDDIITVFEKKRTESWPWLNGFGYDEKVQSKKPVHTPKIDW
jgi:3-isopropylmalate dehydratase